MTFSFDNPRQSLATPSCPERIATVARRRTTSPRKPGNPAMRRTDRHPVTFSFDKPAPVAGNPVMVKTDLHTDTTTRLLPRACGAVGNPFAPAVGSPGTEPPKGPPESRCR